MRTGKVIFIQAGSYSNHTEVKMKGWVDWDHGWKKFKPTEEDRRFNKEHFFEIDVPDDQAAFVVDEHCLKTGLREDDGSMEYCDKGTILILRLIGGEHDGKMIWAQDYGRDVEMQDGWDSDDS